jgi:Uri superfamily endonuclease
MAAQGVPCDPGTYALLLRPTQDLAVPIGRLGTCRLSPGLYVYVGSALGAGGVAARAAHHLRDKHRLHWHIDTLTQQCAVETICWVIGLERLECFWVQSLLRLPGASVPLAGLGSSDCRRGCPAHLVELARGLGPVEVARAVDSIVTKRLPVSWRKVAPWLTPVTIAGMSTTTVPESALTP